MCWEHSWLNEHQQDPCKLELPASMKSNEVTSKWDCLPSEALLIVFKSLGLVPSRHCAQVCKAWANVAESPCLWRGHLPEDSCFESHEEAKQCVIKKLTAKLYTWGTKVVEVPGANFKNRLTCPTVVPGRLMGLKSSQIGLSCPKEYPKK